MTGNQSTADNASVNGTYSSIESQTPGNAVEVATSTEVIMSVAEQKGVSPLELDVRMNDVIDPDALDALVASMKDGHVQFTIADCDVRVQATGDVFVSRR